MIAANAAAVVMAQVTWTSLKTTGGEISRKELLVLAACRWANWSASGATLMTMPVPTRNTADERQQMPRQKLCMDPDPGSLLWA